MTVSQHLSAIRRTLDPGERLRVFPSDPTYAVTDFGKVFSMYHGGKVRPQPRLLTCKPNSYGYITHALRSGVRRAHHLILEAFDGPCPEGMQTRHLDGMKTNNRLSNLCWGTSSENRYDYVHHGGYFSRGEKHGLAVLTEPQVAEIKMRLNNGEAARTMSREYGVSKMTVQDIKTGRTWPQIKAHDSPIAGDPT